MKEVLKIDVDLKETEVVRGSTKEAVMITFDGVCNCEEFQGKILPGGCDTQKNVKQGETSISARYMLEGVDKKGKKCRLFIENNGECEKGKYITYTKPSIITDSKALRWLEETELIGKIDAKENGVIIRIFAV